MRENELKMDLYKTAKSKKSVRYRNIMKRKRDIKNAIKGSGGILSVVAEAIGVDWNTIDKYVNTFDDLRELVDVESEVILDLAENKLIKALHSGERWALEFILRTKGKKRGYYEKREVEENQARNELEKLREQLNTIFDEKN